MRIHRDERGQTIILVALSLPMLLGFVGFATDVGLLLKDKRTIQTAADAAAIAGALSLGPPGSVVTSPARNAAQSAAAANGFPNGNGVVISIPDVPAWAASNYFDKSGYVEVTITKSEPTIFLALFGHPTVTVLARAVATNSGPPAACVYTTGDGVTVPGPGLTVATTMQSQNPQCGLVVDSNSSPPMTVIGTLTMKSIGTVGSCDGGCGDVTPVSGIIPYSDPLAYLPQATCNGTTSCTLGGSTYPCVAAPPVTSGTTLTPINCYNGLTVNGASNVTFSSGIYVINGPLIFNASSISGTGVTFYINSGNVTINSTTLNVSAPTSGNFNGILFDDQGASGLYTATINGIPNSTIAGVMYFPATQLLLTGSSGTSLYTDLVAQSISVSTTNPLSFSDYATAPGVTSSPIPSAALVE